MASGPDLCLMAQHASVSSLRKICVFRALTFGDMLCAVPALRALRTAAPQAHITLIGLSWATSFVRRFSHYINDHLVFPGYPGLTNQALQLHLIPNFISIMQKRRFDLVLQMHSDGTITNPLTMLFDAACYAGFYKPGEYCPDENNFMPWQEHQHEVIRLLNLMAFLGVETQGNALEFPLLEGDFRALQRCAENLPMPGKYACILPGANEPSRRWLPRRFAEIADRLSESGLQIVLNGSASDAVLSREVMRAMRRPCLNLTGKTDLGAFAALASQARIVISNDTGIAHIAAAVDTPSVIASCGSASHQWESLNVGRHRVVRPHTLDSPVDDSVHAHQLFSADKISTGAVLSAVESILAANTL